MVVEYALRLGLATNCRINKISTHDRKNYFYPDLSKGYQISQFDVPLCQGGAVDFYHMGVKRGVRLARIHIEEDTAKLLHDNSFEGTLVDFNRSGVPLIEIVSEPDLRSAEEVKDYLEAVRMLLGALDICNCRMQEGVIRCDINVSVRPVGQAAYGTRVEMKNVNTFNGAVLAVQYESARQAEVLENGGVIEQETRRWDEAKGVSTPMRAKEGAADYRYFPEADLTPLVISDEWIARVKASLPELPVARYERYRGMEIPDFESRLLVESPDKAVFFEKCASIGGVSLKTAANWVIGDVTARLNKASLPIGASPLTPEYLCDILGMIESGEISNDAGRRVLDEVLAKSGAPIDIVEKLSLAQVSDEGQLRGFIRDAMEANPKLVEDYRNGKSSVLGFFVGQCMKASKGKANPQALNELLREMLG
jgi:aspartyl-tRNA(Asn)/glutamyl-tRNA(Gln) amidotransferase subunit B